MVVLNKGFSDGPVRLLIVDDQPHIRSAIAKALALTGYDVDEAASGDEALALLAHASYDLMMLDMVMPGMTGTEVLRRAREINPELLIVVLTGHATLESAIMAVKSAATDYLLKPISIHDIIDAITRALQKRTARAQKIYLDDVMDVTPQSELPPTLSRFTEEGWSQLVYAYPLRLDRSNRIVEFENDSSKMVTLSKGETAVLGSLMEKPGHVFSCQQIVLSSWGYKLERIEAESVIRPYISRLRRKIEINPQKPMLIQTIRRRGYQFTVIER
jgi:DNA-binding response OmpR family regulator